MSSWRPPQLLLWGVPLPLTPQVSNRLTSRCNQPLPAQCRKAPPPRQQLNALLAEWDQAGFDTPSKPSQYRVYGRNGHVTNGEGYNHMVSLIRSAVSNVRDGRTRDAATEIAEARHLLATTNQLKLASQ